MKIALVSEYNLYTTIGGTETYVDMLMKGLVRMGHSTSLITQGKDFLPGRVDKQPLDGASVYFLPGRNYSRDEIRQKKVSSTWEDILPILKAEKPDIVHVHTLSTFFNQQHLILCRQQSFTTFFTTHVPSHFCSKGDLIQNNKKPCDGKVGAKCALCLFSGGAAVGLSSLLNGYYLKPLKLLKTLEHSGVQLMGVANWQKLHVVANGFPKERVNVIRQAISIPDIRMDEKGKAVTSKLIVGYLGRFSSEKGAAFLLELMENMQHDEDVRFILGIPLQNSEPSQVEKLRSLQFLMGDKIRILENINSTNKNVFFDNIDCLLIPSFFWETGPIVLLEAILYNRTILAPNIGGTAEYALEFPDMVKTYQWENMNDAKEKLGMLLKAGRNTSIQKNNFLKLKEKETEFITKHLELYKEVHKLSAKDSLVII